MNMRLIVTGLLACLPAAAIADTPAAIPGPDGGWDYAKVDTETNTLFIAHGDTVGAVDLANPTAVKAFAPAHHAHAVLPIPGTLSLDHLKENLAALDIELTDADFRALSDG